MAAKNTQQQHKSIALPTDVKPRLKWTPELHQLFVNAVALLGGAVATPRALMTVMGIKGLSLLHVKSHLQKYRLREGHQENERTHHPSNGNQYQINKRSHGPRFTPILPRGLCVTHWQYQRSLDFAQNLQMRMEVQRKHHDQVEKRLRMRIEAQGKHLQSISKRLQHLVSGHNCSCVKEKRAKAEVSQFPASIVNNKWHQSSDSSTSAETEESSWKDSQGKHEYMHRANKCNPKQIAMHLENENESVENATRRKTSGSTISIWDDNYVVQLHNKRSRTQQYANLLERKVSTIDLNTHFLDDLNVIEKR